MSKETYIDGLSVSQSEQRVHADIGVLLNYIRFAVMLIMHVSPPFGASALDDPEK